MEDDAAGSCRANGSDGAVGAEVTAADEETGRCTRRWIAGEATLSTASLDFAALACGWDRVARLPFSLVTPFLS